MLLPAGVSKWVLPSAQNCGLSGQWSQVATCCELNSKNVDARCDKRPSAVGRTKLAILATVDVRLTTLASVSITLSAHLIKAAPCTWGSAPRGSIVNGRCLCDIVALLLMIKFIHHECSTSTKMHYAEHTIENRDLRCHKWNKNLKIKKM